MKWITMLFFITICVLEIQSQDSLTPKISEIANIEFQCVVEFKLTPPENYAIVSVLGDAGERKPNGNGFYKAQTGEILKLRCLHLKTNQISEISFQVNYDVWGRLELLNLANALSIRRQNKLEQELADLKKKLAELTSVKKELADSKEQLDKLTGLREELDVLKKELAELKSKPVAEKPSDKTTEEKPSDKTSFVKPEPAETLGIPTHVWNACKYQHQGEWILDMTTDAWLGLSAEDQQKYGSDYQKGYAQAKGLQVEKTITKSGATFSFRLIPPGRFWMGSPDSEKDRKSDETRHRVVISKAFYIGKTEVTQGQWQAVMGNNPSYFNTAGAGAPVENVSWNDCCEGDQSFFGKTNFVLPTEAQWEYAARAGSTRAYCFGDDSKTLDDYAWYRENGLPKIHLVAEKNCNGYGLYDVHGNVWEWCQDWYGDYPKDDVTDPTGTSSGTSRCCRGGSWHFGRERVRVSYRFWNAPAARGRALGFRPVY